MLSICIPVYNFDVVPLVDELLDQLQRVDFQYEILVYDDCSAPNWKTVNFGLSNRKHVKYYELPANIGRSAIRNLLAADAQFSSLLFMDCDAQVVSESFIASYKQFLGQKIAVCGGLTYQIAKPNCRDLHLHWLYGNRREKKSALRRSKNPYESFSTFNFLIDKDLMTEIQFDNYLTQYGHEDTLFGIKLKQRGILIQHIDNPLLHNGLETNVIFIEKTKLGIQNLIFIEQKSPEAFRYFSFSSLIRTYNRLANWKLETLFLLKFRWIEKFILKNLLGKNPSLFLFDIFKLGYYAQLKRDTRIK